MNYVVLVIELEFYLPYAHSLKEKRGQRLRLTERLRQQYKLSIAEVGSQEEWQRLELALAYVAIREHTALEMREKIHESVLDLLEDGAELLRFESEIV